VKDTELVRGQCVLHGNEYVILTWETKSDGSIMVRCQEVKFAGQYGDQREFFSSDLTFLVGKILALPSPTPDNPHGAFVNPPVPASPWA
jgi:hypothetical protein